MKYRWVVTYISDQYRSGLKEINVSVIAIGPIDAVECFRRAVTTYVVDILKLERKEKLI